MTEEYDNNEAGFCFITFKEGVSDEKIQEAINDFYKKNEGIFLGMYYGQTKAKFLKKCKDACDAVLKEK